MIRVVAAPRDEGERRERRGETRQPIELKVEYQRLNAFLADYTKNISRGGSFIQTDKPLPVGTEFVFRLIVPGLGEPLRIRGQVKWVVEPVAGAEVGEAPVAPPGMGIRFLYADEEDRRSLAERVGRLMTA